MRSQRVSTACNGRVAAFLKGGKGQSTVEFALVTAAFLCIAFALGALWDVLKEGVAVQHAIASASHHVQSGALGNIADLFLY